ncbi:FHA domain-containing protein [Cohnella sp. WQ 127256]|uniref:FHA domain-containing protein n=1 Tax=Cohnella sp. WQ 127256 TaxID=2938790 RepID=UPI0021176535
MNERKRVKIERGNSFKFTGIMSPRRFKAILSSSILIVGLQASPIHAWAAGSVETSITQVKAGTLPLLASLGLGIAVAVGAVIAFLQMTAKGKGANKASILATENEADEVEEADEAIAEGTYDEYINEDWNDDDHSLSDYTIPVTQIMRTPEQAELAEETEPRLCGLEGEHAGSSYRILNRRLIIGRDPAQCVILFPYEASEISRVHCTLRFNEENRLFFLEDNGSSNGTFLLNGERLKPGVRYELHSGERFSLSGKEHWFEVQDQVEQSN